jgi:hypothetical protein
MSFDRDLRRDVDGYVPQVQVLYPVEAPIGGGDGALLARRTGCAHRHRGGCDAGSCWRNILFSTNLDHLLNYYRCLPLSSDLDGCIKW